MPFNFQACCTDSEPGGGFNVVLMFTATWGDDPR